MINKVAIATFILAILTGLLAGCGISNGTEPKQGGDFSLVSAKYPELPKYPIEDDYLKKNGEFEFEAYDKEYTAWRQALLDFRGKGSTDYNELMAKYIANSTRAFAEGLEGKNVVYSPVNTYLAFAMLAEITDGNSRQQILDALGCESIEQVRQTATGLWNSHYVKDGTHTSLLGNSLWLRKDADVNLETINALAERYFASVFSGEMGSAEYDEALQSWINEQTGNLLTEKAGGLHMDPTTVLALVSTIFYQDSWAKRFEDIDTLPRTFHKADNTDVTADFMNSSAYGALFYGEKYIATSKYFENGGSMWFLLPNEGVSAEELLADDEAMDLLIKNNENAQLAEDNIQRTQINLFVPKFDVSSDIDMKNGMRALGITDVLDDSLSDFSPLSDSLDNLAVSEAQHAARVKIDEDGVEAAAYTIIMVAETAFFEIPAEVDFVLDRPFVFAITDHNGLPTFIGVVNTPME